MDASSPKSLQKQVLTGLLAFIVAAVGLFALYSWAVMSWAYSAGERAGYVQKFSRKGWVCKTWEGELAMVAMPGTLAEKFPFTVRDEAVANRVNATMGKRVAISYEQHVGLPSSCFGETAYFITEVKLVD